MRILTLVFLISVLSFADTKDNNIKVIDSIMIKGGIISSKFNPNDDLLIVGSGDRTFKVLDTKKWNIIRSVPCQSGNITSILFSNDGKFIFTGDTEGNLCIWNTSKWQLLYTIQACTYSILNIAISDDHNYLAMHDEYKLVIYRINYDELITSEKEKQHYSNPIVTQIGMRKMNSFQNYSSYSNITFTTNGKSLIIAETSGGISSIDLSRMTLEWEYKIGSKIICLTWDKNQQNMIISTGDSEVRIININDREQIKRFECANILHSIELVKSDPIIAGIGGDGNLYLYGIGGELMNKYNSINKYSDLIIMANKMIIIAVTSSGSAYIYRTPILSLIKKEVENRINEWQKKGKYEKTDEYRRRVSPENRQLKIEEYLKEETNNIAKSETALSFIGATTEYDADNEVFKITLTDRSQLFIKVPSNEAEEFDKKFKTMVVQDEQYIVNEKSQFSLLHLKVINPENNKVYLYDSSTPLSFYTSKLDMKFDPLEVEISNTKTETNINQGTKVISVGKSDVDINIRETGKLNTDAVAVVIGNREYKKKDIPIVEYAVDDASTVKEYLVNTFGYKIGNILFYTNATQADFNSIFGTKENYKGKLFNYVKEGKSDVVIYYSGHGAPDPESKQGYFVPIDCDPSTVALNGYSLATLYENLAKIKSKSLTVVIDACFSGSSDKGMLLQNISPVFIKVDNPVKADANTIILTSANGDQVSSWYPEKRHSLFTYYFLKALQGEGDLNKDKNLTLGEIKEYISENVPYMARRLNNREQTPQVIGDENKVLVKY